MSNLMINEFFCEKILSSSISNSEGTGEYKMVYSPLNAFTYTGGIKKGDFITIDFNSPLTIWKVIDITHAIIKDPDVPSEKAYLDFMPVVTGTIKIPDTEDESEAPTADE